MSYSLNVSLEKRKPRSRSKNKLVTLRHEWIVTSYMFKKDYFSTNFKGTYRVHPALQNSYSGHLLEAMDHHFNEMIQDPFLVDFIYEKIPAVYFSKIFYRETMWTKIVEEKNIQEFMSYGEDYESYCNQIIIPDNNLKLIHIK